MARTKFSEQEITDFRKKVESSSNKKYDIAKRVTQKEYNRDKY